MHQPPRRVGNAFIKKFLFMLTVSTGLPAAAQANSEGWVTGNEQTNPRLQIRIEDKNAAFTRDYAAALERRVSFDLDNTKFYAYYNINRPAESHPSYVNACLSHLADIYGRGHTNIFFAPQWQYGIRKYTDNFTTWYDLPPSPRPFPEALPERLCTYQFTPEIVAQIRRNYPYFMRTKSRFAPRFGLALSAINQHPAGLFNNAYTPAFNLTPAPVGALRLQKPAKVNLADFSAQYAVDDQELFAYTGIYRTDYIWGLVYQEPGNSAINYVASYPNYRYDSVNNREFLQPHGTQARLTISDLYPQDSTNYSFPNGVPVIPEGAQAYLRVEARAFPKNFGAAARTVFMVPHEDTPSGYEYGYESPTGEFTPLAACSVNFNDCFPADRTVDFLIKITDPDLVHSVTGNYYLGSSSSAQDRAARNLGQISVTFYDPGRRPRGQTAITLTTGFNLAQAYDLINRGPDFFDQIYFELRTRDYLGGSQATLYGLALPVRHTGEVRVGYAPAGNNQTDVFADGSGLLTVDVSGVTFPGLTPYAYQWYLGTTAIRGAISTTFYLRYNYVDYLEANQVPVKVKVAYTDGNLRYQVLEQTFAPPRLELRENAHEFFSDGVNPVVTATIHGLPPDWTFITGELLRNTDGGGSFQALPRAAQQQWAFTPAHWEALYAAHGNFPAPSVWTRRPAYKARFLIQQSNGFLVWMQSQVLEIPRPPSSSCRSR